MLIGIISDVHGDLAALDRALELMGPVHEVLCAGDLVMSYRFSNDAVRRLQEIGARVVLGNHDLDVLGPQGSRVRESPRTDPELLAWLSQQPTHLDVQIDGRRLVMFHATPGTSFEYVYRQSASIREWDALGADYVIYGHTHYPLELRLARTLVINPGSTGQPRDPSNGFRSSFAVLDTRSQEVRLELY